MDDFIHSAVVSRFHKHKILPNSHCTESVIELILEPFGMAHCQIEQAPIFVILQLWLV